MLAIATEARVDFDATLVEPLRGRTMLLAGLSAGAIAVFVLVDLVVGPFEADVFSVRIGAVAALGALAATFRREMAAAAVLAFAFGVYLVDMLSVCLVLAFAIAARSELYAALYIVLLGPPIFFCYRPTAAFALIASLLAPAVVTTLALAEELRPAAIRLAFLGVLAVVSFVVSRATYHLRRREFDSTDLMRRAHADLQETQVQLVQAEKLSALGTLSACVAHELNQPLTVLLGYTSVMATRLRSFTGKPDEIEALRRTLESMRHAGERASTIVDHLRRYARSAERAPVRTLLEQALQGALLFVEGDIRGRGIDLRLELAPEGTPVLGEAVELEQVVLNLLTNARDAVAECTDPRIVVRTLRRETTSILEVLDNGPGISPELRERIFDPFFTTKPEGAGTGLGLPIAQTIARRHQGELEILDYPEGVTCFRLSLPLEADVAAPEAGAADVDPQGDPPCG
jgi:signal transduction histidine kinase